MICCLAIWSDHTLTKNGVTSSQKIKISLPHLFYFLTSWSVRLAWSQKLGDNQAVHICITRTLKFFEIQNRDHVKRKKELNYTKRFDCWRNFNICRGEHSDIIQSIQTRFHLSSNPFTLDRQNNLHVRRFRSIVLPLKVCSMRASHLQHDFSLLWLGGVYGFIYFLLYFHASLTWCVWVWMGPSCWFLWQLCVYFPIEK